MSDSNNTPADEAPHDEVADVVTPGARLKDAREKLGLSQQHIADKLFLKVAQIDDLEHDRIDAATSITFIRGYVRNYGRFVGLDTQALLAEFESLHTSSKQPAKLQSFSQRVAKQTQDDRWMMVTYAILLMLIAGVVVWWYQQTDKPAFVEEPVQRSESPSKSDVVVSEQNVTVPQSISVGSESTPISAQASEDAKSDRADEPVEAQLAEQPTATPEPDSQGDARLSMPETSDSVVREITQSSEASVTNESEDIDSAAPSETTPLSAQSIQMVFTFSDDCWVNIEDATGEAIAYGIKVKGRVMTISGVAPVEVTLGAPENVQITVDGNAVDMSVYQTGRTARFTLPIQGE